MNRTGQSAAVGKFQIGIKQCIISVFRQRLYRFTGEYMFIFKPKSTFIKMLVCINEIKMDLWVIFDVAKLALFLKPTEYFTLFNDKF